MRGPVFGRMAFGGMAIPALLRAHDLPRKCGFMREAPDTSLGIANNAAPYVVTSFPSGQRPVQCQG
ncbi:hypothetical protein MBLL_01683 (plasmid) [Methylobacterium bullatum]|uniref:Uncharacterized protein n=1 Tax=Methylobacterium bullatum TaxID=570505 RepID=A0A679K688_9HYPH|nr:hypothetical protein MBLL_01683 [Methylobacterium bullatum]